MQHAVLCLRPAPACKVLARGGMQRSVLHPAYLYCMEYTSLNWMCCRRSPSFWRSSNRRKAHDYHMRPELPEICDIGECTPPDVGKACGQACKSLYPASHCNHSNNAGVFVNGYKNYVKLSESVFPTAYHSLDSKRKRNLQLQNTRYLVTYAYDRRALSRRKVWPEQCARTLRSAPISADVPPH